MKKVLLVLGVILILQVVDSYILLTANMEDVQTVAKQLSSSPVVDQLKKIWRRAQSQFNAELNKPSKRHRINEDRGTDADPLDSKEIYRRRNMDALISLGKNASDYIKSVKDVFTKFVS